MTAFNDVTGHRHDRRVTTGVSRLSKISSRAPAASPLPSPIIPPRPPSVRACGSKDRRPGTGRRPNLTGLNYIYTRAYHMRGRARMVARAT